MCLFHLEQQLFKCQALFINRLQELQIFYCFHLLPFMIYKVIFTFNCLYPFISLYQIFFCGLIITKKSWYGNRDPPSHHIAIPRPRWWKSCSSSSATSSSPPAGADRSLRSECSLFRPFPDRTTATVFHYIVITQLNDSCPLRGYENFFVRPWYLYQMVEKYQKQLRMCKEQFLLSDLFKAFNQIESSHKLDIHIQ